MARKKNKSFRTLLPSAARAAISTIVIHFDRLSDPRIERGKRHALINVIVLALLGTICGAEGWDDFEEYAETNAEWLAEFLDFPDGDTPSDDTFRRVFTALHPQRFAECVNTWLSELCGSLVGKTIPIDGKTLRRAFDRAKGLSPLHVVEAWVCENNVVLGQVIAENGDEFGAVAKLLESFDVTGALLTLDAGFCHHAHCAKIIASNAEYLIAVKGNQPKLQAAIVAHFKDPEVGRSIETRDDAHGRKEIRKVRVASASVLGALRREWCGAKSVVCVDRVRYAEELSVSRVCYITSVAPSEARRIATAIRQHWSIENTLHWALDVAFREDESRVRQRSAAANLAVIRRSALTLLKNHQGKRKTSIRIKRWLAGMKPDLALSVLCGQNLASALAASKAF